MFQLNTIDRLSAITESDFYSNYKLEKLYTYRIDCFLEAEIILSSTSMQHKLDCKTIKKHVKLAYPTQGLALFLPSLHLAREYFRDRKQV